MVMGQVRLSATRNRLQSWIQVVGGYSESFLNEGNHSSHLFPEPSLDVEQHSSWPLRFDLNRQAQWEEWGCHKPQLTSCGCG